MANAKETLRMKALCLVPAIAASFTLTACSGEKADQASAEPAPSAPAETAATE